MNDFNDDFLRIRNIPDRWQPEIEHRTLIRIQVGSWFFGLLPVYKYVYSDWGKDEHINE